MPTELTIWSLIAVVLVIFSTRRISMWRTVASLRLDKPRYQITSDETVPANLRTFFMPATNELLELGFRPLGWVCFSEILHLSNHRQLACVLADETNGVYALVTDVYNAILGPDFQVILVTVIGTNRSVVTSSATDFYVLGEMPNMVLNIEWAPSIKEKMASHLNVVSAHRLPGLSMNPMCLDSLIAELERAAELHLVNLEHTGIIRPIEEGKYAIRATKVPSLSDKLMKVDRNFERLAKQKNKSGIRSVVSDETSRRFYEKHWSDRESVHSCANFKWWLFVLSTVVSVGAFAVILSIAEALVICTVILIHELGHYVTMRMFRYRDVHIVMVPLLGGAAVGGADLVPIHRQIITYLAGPVPGIFIGFLLYTVADRTGNSSYVFAAAFFLILNYINLLPLLPFDGGHVVRLLGFTRRPAAVFTLMAISALVLATASFKLVEPILGLLAVLLVWLCIVQWQDVRLMRLLEPLKNRPFDSIKLLREAIFEAIAGSPLEKLRFIQKIGLVRRTEQVLTTERLPWKFGVPSCGVFLVFLICVPYGINQFFQSNSDRWEHIAKSGDDPAADIRKLAENTWSAKGRLRILSHAGDYYENRVDDYTEAERYYREALQIARDHMSGHESIVMQLVHLWKLTQVMDDDVERASFYSEMLKFVNAGHRISANKLNEIYTSAAYAYWEIGELGQAEAMMKKAIETLPTGLDKDQAASLHLGLGEILLERDEEELGLRELQSAALLYDRDRSIISNPAIERMVDYFAEKHRFAEAAALLETAITNSVHPKVGSRAYRREINTRIMLGWLLFLNGAPDHAKSHLLTAMNNCQQAADSARWTEYVEEVRVELVLDLAFFDMAINEQQSAIHQHDNTYPFTTDQALESYLEDLQDKLNDQPTHWLSVRWTYHEFLLRSG